MAYFGFLTALVMILDGLIHQQPTGAPWKVRSRRPTAAEKIISDPRVTPNVRAAIARVQRMQLVPTLLGLGCERIESQDQYGGPATPAGLRSRSSARVAGMVSQMKAAVARSRPEDRSAAPREGPVVGSKPTLSRAQTCSCQSHASRVLT